MGKPIPELNYLMSEVEKHYGRRIATSADFESLSILIERETNEMLSASTLKRMWGYVTRHPVPRLATLDILSRYIGYKNFSDFRDYLKKSSSFESSFFSAKVLDVTTLSAGVKVIITWNPNRVVELEYLGGYRFKVISSLNSQLLSGDVFTASSFIQDHPLYIAGVTRGLEDTSPYIAGSNRGLTSITVED